jgi:arrestin-1
LQYFKAREKENQKKKEKAKENTFIMMTNFKVYKKCSPNNKLAIYLAKRDFIDYLSGTEPIDGIISISQDYMDSNRKIWCQLVCSFRYGREEDEVMGLNFQKDLYLASEQIFPQIKKLEFHPTKLQDRLDYI